MRIMGFSKKWTKLSKQWFNRDFHTFTTFRYPRRDRDWEIEEVVQVVFRTRFPDREPLGIARIIRKEEKNLDKTWNYYPFPSFQNTPDMIDSSEAEEDGFTGSHGWGDVKAMIQFIRDYGREPIVNKLTLYWIEKFK